MELPDILIFMRQWILIESTVVRFVPPKAAQNTLCSYFYVLLLLFLRSMRAVRLLAAGFPVRTPPDFTLGRSFVSSSHDWFKFLIVMK